VDDTEEGEEAETELVEAGGKMRIEKIDVELEVDLALDGSLSLFVISKLERPDVTGPR